LFQDIEKLDAGANPLARGRVLGFLGKGCNETFIRCDAYTPSPSMKVSYLTEEGDSLRRLQCPAAFPAFSCETVSLLFSSPVCLHFFRANRHLTLKVF
jgi:hypothetical protein